MSLRNSNGFTVLWALNTGGIYKFRDFRQYEKRYKIGHSFYWTVIGHHVRSVEAWHVRWPWVTFEGHFGDLRVVVSLRAQLTRDLLTIAEFLAVKTFDTYVLSCDCIIADWCWSRWEKSSNCRKKNDFHVAARFGPSRCFPAAAWSRGQL